MIKDNLHSAGGQGPSDGVVGRSSAPPSQNPKQTDSQLTIKEVGAYWDKPPGMRTRADFRSVMEPILRGTGDILAQDLFREPWTDEWLSGNGESDGGMLMGRQRDIVLCMKGLKQGRRLEIFAMIEDLAENVSLDEKEMGALRWMTRELSRFDGTIFDAAGSGILKRRRPMKLRGKI